MLAYKVHNQRAILQDKIVEYISNEVDFEVPEALIDAEVEARVRNLAARLEEDKIDLQNYLRITGQDEATFIASLRDQANAALSTRVLLDSIAAIENYEVTDEEILEYVTEMFQGQIEDPQVIVDSWGASGQIESLVGDILRERAITGLIDSARPVDADGNPVDLTPVVIEPREQDEQDEEELEDDPADEVEDASGASDDDVSEEIEESEETE